MIDESQPDQPDELDQPQVRPLVVIKGDASPDEVAALVAVVQALAAGAGAQDPAQPRSVWADPARQMRGSHSSGTAGWRRSALPS